MLNKAHGAAKERGLPGPRVEVAQNTAQALSQPRVRRGLGHPSAAALATRIVAHPDAEPFVAQGEDWTEAVLADFTQRFEAVGPAEAAVLYSAGLELAASRFLFAAAMKNASMGDIETAADVANLLKTASKLAGASRQNTMAAWEMCVRTTKVDGDEPDEVDANEAARLAEERAAQKRAGGTVVEAGEE